MFMPFIFSCVSSSSLSSFVVFCSLFLLVVLGVVVLVLLLLLLLLLLVCCLVVFAFVFAVAIVVVVGVCKFRVCVVGVCKFCVCVCGREGLGFFLGGDICELINIADVLICHSGAVWGG